MFRRKKRAPCRYLSDSKLRQYHERSIPPEERVLINEHLTVCDFCYQRYSETYPGRGGRKYVEIDWKVDESSAHLDFDKEMVPYVDGRINETEREFIEIHVSHCAQCAREVRELREFAEKLEREP